MCVKGMNRIYCVAINWTKFRNRAFWWLQAGLQMMRQKISSKSIDCQWSKTARLLQNLSRRPHFSIAYLFQ